MIVYYEGDLFLKKSKVKFLSWFMESNLGLRGDFGVLSFIRLECRETQEVNIWPARRDFPGSPVAKTPHPWQKGGPGVHSCLRKLDPEFYSRVKNGSRSDPTCHSQDPVWPINMKIKITKKKKLGFLLPSLSPLRNVFLSGNRLSFPKADSTH